MSDKMMDTIQKLLNQAAGAATDAERDAFQTRADQLMFKYKIDQAMLRIRNSENTPAPRTEVTDEVIEWVDRTDEFRDIHTAVVVNLSRLTGVRLVLKGWSQLHVIGYPQDIQYFRMLWVGTHLTFSGKLFPKWETGRTDGENIRAMAESGIKWLAIWQAARNAGQPMLRKERGTGEMVPVPAPPNDGGWMKRKMADAYKATGEVKPKLTHGVRNYRDSFAVGFSAAFEQRVWGLIASRRQRENEAGSGVGVVLRTDATAVDDYFNRLYPPSSLSAAGPGRKLAAGYGAAAERGAAAGRSVDLAGSSGRMNAGSPRGQLG
jgi:hypothetical protein